MHGRHFDETERREGVETFFHGDIQGAPASGQILDDLIGEHDDERMGPGSGFAAYEDGAHFEVRGFTGPKRLLDRGQIFVAIMHDLFVCLLWCQVGFEHVAAIEFGGFLLRVLIEGQQQSAPLEGQFDPVSEAQLFCPRHELLQRPLGVGARMGGEVVVLFGNVHLEVRPIFLRLAERTRAHAFVVMLAYQIIRYLAACWNAFDVTVEEGLHALTTLCLVEVSPMHAPSYHCIPTPRDAIAQLLHRADIKLPKAFSLSGTRVSTKKKLPSERLVQ